jgi:putative transposase
MLGKRANLLRNVIIDKALQAISSDITEIVYANGKEKAYVAVHKDIFAQVAYGWQIGQDMKKDLVIRSLKKAVRSIQRIFKITELPQQLIWHQDQGSQYTSYEYINDIMKYGRISYSRKGTPTDNPGQESFFGRLKDEHKQELFECESFQEVSKQINKIINSYNYKRLHTTIGYVPPMEFLKNIIAHLF